MKYLLLLALGIFATSCSHRMVETMKPDHLGITPSCEWEIQEGCKPKHKPKISTTLDWNF